MSSILNISAQDCINLNAESGNFENWKLFTGTFDEPFLNSGLDPLSHRIFSGTMQDPNIPTLQVSAIDNYSFILGDFAEGNEVDVMLYKIDVTENNYLIVVNYLPIFSQLAEPELKASNFSIQITDGQNPASDCFDFRYFSDLNNLSYEIFEVNNAFILYSEDWLSTAISLKDYIGSTVSVILTAEECSFSGHFNYTYLDLQYITPKLSVYNCNNNFIVEAPAGFSNYQWSNGEVGQQTSVVSMSQLNGLSVDVYNDSNCVFNISDFEIIGQESFDLQIDYEAGNLTCEQNPIEFNFNIKPIISLTNLEWDFGDGNTSNEISPTHTFQYGGEHIVQLSFTSEIGCEYAFNKAIIASGVLDPGILIADRDFCSQDGIIDLPNPDEFFNLNHGKFSGEAIVNGTINPTFHPELVTGDSSLVTFHFEDINSCNDTVYFYMHKRDISVSDIDDITLIQTNQAEVFIPMSGEVEQISWSPEIGLSCIDCNNPTIQVENDIVYTVSAANSFGCVDSTSFSIQVINSDVFIPTAFTPNNDALNDIFYVRGNTIERIESLTIYSRYGSLIFQTQNVPPNDFSVGWNGYYKNQTLNSAVFIYEVVLLLKNGSKELKRGSVLLMR